MADILDVITRLGYDVDSTKLAEAYQQLINQISALSTLSDRVKKLEDIKKAADTENINRINRINAAIEITNTKIKAQITSIHDQVLANEQLRKSIEGYISVINRAVTDQQKMQNVIASSFAAEQQKLEALKGNVASLNSELAKLSGKKEYGFGGQITDLTAKLNSATQAVIKQQAEVDKLAAEYAKISGLNPIDYSGAKEGLIGGLQSRIAQLRDALPFANAKEDIRELNLEINRLEKELRELQAIGREPILSGLNPIDYSGVKEGLIGGRQSRISQLRDALPFANTKEDIKEINREIDRLEKELRELQAIGRKPIIRSAEVVQAAQAVGGLEQSSKATTFTLTNLSYIVQDLPFGFIGIANNITPLIQSFSQLKEETGTTQNAFKQLLTGLTGPQGLFLAVSVVTSLLLTFGDRLFDSGNEAEKAAEKIKKEEQAVKNLNDELQRNIELRLRQRDIALNAHNQGINEARREEELSKARGDSEEQQYEESKRRIEKEKQDLEDRLQVYAGFINRVTQLFRYYREQERNQGFKEGVYNDLISENVAKLIAETLQVSQEEATVQAENLLKTFGTEQSVVNTWLNEKSKLYEDVKDKDVQLEVLRLNYIREQREKEKKTNDEAYKNALEQIDNELELKKLNDSLLQIIASRIATAVEVNRSLKQLRMEEGKPYTAAEQEAMDKQLESDIKFYESLRAIQEKRLELGALQQKIATADNMGQSSTAFRLSARKLDEEIFTSRMPREYIDAIPDYNPLDPKNVSDAMKETRRVIEKEDEKQFKKADELRKKRNKERIAAAKDLANSLIQIMEQVNARQIALLDQEIQIRQQRVSQTTELAKAGNAEILQSEQERLNETMKERKKAANEQLQLNAAMQLSSAALAAAQAIETITNAGTKGDPYTIAIRIAAAVAALGAGIFAVKSLMGGAYKDGVVDFKGKGTGTSDSNIVRISRGESVITAKATSKYRDVLEAMNANKPLPMPITLQPIQSPNTSYRTLERRLDKIAGLLEGNGVNVRTSVTNGQIATIVESQRKIESRRWS